MPFVLQRTGTSLVKKSVNFSVTPSVVNNSASLGSTGNVNTATINTLTLSGTQITATGAEINKLSGITAGTAAGNKALILDSSRNVSNINSLECTSLTVNGVAITSGGSGDGSGGSSETPTELSGITAGIGSASKALVLDSSRNITNINNLTLNNLTIPTNVGDTTVFTDWTTDITPSVNSAWNKLIYVEELQLYIALSSTVTSICIMTSPNGINWTSRSVSGTARTWNNICWSSYLKMCVLVGNDGYTAYSYNGTSWTQNSQIASGTGKHLEGIVWLQRHNMFLAANNTSWSSDEYGFYWSKNGISWNSAKKGSGGYLKTAVYAPALGMAIFIGNSASSNPTNIPYEYVSTTEPFTDNITSSSAHSIIPIGAVALPRRTFRSIAWSEHLGLFVAVATATTFSEYTIIYSENGMSWNTISSPFIANWSRVIWCSKINIFVAVSDDSSNSIMMTSINGINWSKYDDFMTTNTISDIVWNPKRLELVGISRNLTAPIKVFLTKHSYSISNNIVLGTNNILGNTSSSSLVSKDDIIYNSTNFGNHVFTSNNRELVTINANGCIGINNCVNSQYPIELNTNGVNAILLHNLLPGQGASNKTTECSIHLDNSGNLSINTVTNTNGIGEVNLYNSFLNVKGSQWKINGGIVTANANQLNYVAGVSAGTATASKAVILDGNKYLKDISRIYIGGNVAPTNLLELASDSAVKPSTSTWTISSDQRLKEDIVDADLDICYNNIKQLKLRYYKWKDDVYTVEQVPDRHKVGWIADEVEQVIPKAVTITNAHGFEDCKTLNSDQIITQMYGTIQKLIQKVESLEDFMNSLDITTE